MPDLLSPLDPLGTLDLKPNKPRRRLIMQGGRGPRERTLESPRLEVPALIRYRAPTEEHLRRKVPRMLPQLVRQYFKKELMPFHKLMLDLLWQGGFVDLMVPTEHGKSTICNVMFPILSLMHNPDAAHIICCTNIDDARDWLAVIQRELEHNQELIRDFPWVGKRKDRSWTRTELTVAGRANNWNRNPSVLAAARGQDDIRQRRGMFIADDLEGRNAVMAEAREQLYDWVMKEAMRCIEDPQDNPRRLWANVGTPYDVDSIHFRLAKTGRFRVFRQPYKYPTGQLIWPYKRVKINEYRQLWSGTIGMFEVAMELDPKAGNAGILSWDDLEEKGIAKEAKLPEEDTYTFVGLDPASGSKHRRADYAGLSVTRVSWPQEDDEGHNVILPQVEVLHAFRVTDEAIDQVHQAAQLARDYHCPVLVEVNAMQAIYKGLFSHFAPDVRVIRHLTRKETKRDNRMGLTVLKTLVRQNRFKMINVEASLGMQTLMGEIRDLGTNAADHIAITVWFAVRWVYEHRRRRPAVIMRSSGVSGYSPMMGGRVIDMRMFKGTPRRDFVDQGA